MSKLTNDEYQKFCATGLKKGNDLVTYMLGLGGEAGECLDIVKKARRDQTTIDRVHLMEEIGDVYWYLSNICTELNVSIDSVLEMNRIKLKKRYKL